MTAGGQARWPALARHAENALTAAALVLMAVLPVLEIVLRTVFGAGIPGNSGYVQNLTLWVGFLGAMIASRERRHLSLSTGMVSLSPRLDRTTDMLAAALSAMVACGLSWASFQFVRAEMESPARIGGWLPIWLAEAILPVAFAVIALRFVAQAGDWRERALVSLAIPAVAAIGFLLEPYAPQLVWPGVAGLAAAAILGAPIFVVLGGAALIFFFADGVPVAAIAVEIYSIAVSPAIPALPLFTLAGFVLAEGGSSRRLVRLFRALFGWLPGGLAIATTLVCAFFTTFTGASGVTILALGGLLLPVLLSNGYGERFSVGLLTATGSIGLLFPPSLAVILYSVVAHVPIPDLFVAAIVPGSLMVAAACLLGVHAAWRARAPRSRFDPSEAARALWQSKWELMLPVIVVGGIFGGFGTLNEAAAVTAVYALFIETVVHRDLHPTRDLPGVLVGCTTLIGGILMILCVAMGLTNYLVDAQVPMKAAAWVTAHIESRILFLLALNLSLLAVGCLMDIFSATVVVVPLILPVGLAFGIDPLHLGIIFLVNLELGYLTPPVGMNLLISAFRFDRPLLEVCRSALPFLLVLGLVLLLVTYVPILTLGLAGAG